MRLGHTIIYVENVPETVAFYENAFGLERRFVHESNLYAEMKTGSTILSFASYEAAEMNGLAILPNKPTEPAAGWEICFITADIFAAFEKAVAKGCRAVCRPQEKPWGQSTCFVRDLNGCLVEIATPMEMAE